MIKFSTAIALAEEQGACDEEMKVIRSMSGWEEFWVHPRAPKWAYWYAKHILEGRWPDAENVIMTNTRWAYWYARHIIHGRWREAEPVFMTDPRWACWYASNIKGRWPEAEDVIKTDPYWWELYVKNVIEKNQEDK